MTQYRSKSKGHKQKDPGLELSVGQVLAAAGATVVGSIIAKSLNLWGTVAGTAILSVCSSIGAVLILRAMRRTGDTIKAQIAAMTPPVKGEASAPTVEIHPESVSATAKIPDTERLKALGDETVEIEVPDEAAPEGHVTNTRSRKRTLIAILVSSVLVFGLTIGTLYLLGVFTGDPDRFIDNADPETTVGETTDESDEPSQTEETGETGSPTEDAAESQSETGSPSESASESTSPSESATTESGQGGGDAATQSTDPQEDAASPTESATAD